MPIKCTADTMQYRLVASHHGLVAIYFDEGVGIVQVG